MAGLADEPDLIEPESSFVTTPAGRTGRITMSDTNDWSYSAHYFTDSDSWIYLQGWSPDPDAADWPSLAETFEFLPSDVQERRRRLRHVHARPMDTAILGPRSMIEALRGPHDPPTDGTPA